MQEDRIYYKDLAFYEKAGEKEKQKSIDKYFDLAKLPTDRMRAEMKRFIIERGTRIMYHSITHENSHFNYLICIMSAVFWISLRKSGFNC